MKKIILLLLFSAGLVFWSCNKEQSIKTSLKKIEKLESDVLSSITKIEEYRTSLERFLIDSPESEYAPRAWFKLAKLNEVFGHYEKAVDYYTNLATLFPEDPVSGNGIFNLAQIYELHLNQDKKAITAYQQLITLYPNNKSIIAAHLKLGQLYCKQNDWPNGLAVFELIIKKFPENKICDDLQFRIADILEHQMKDTTKAKAEYQQLVDAYPGSPWAVRAETRIEQLVFGGEKNEN